MPGAVALPMPPVPPAPGAASKDDESWPAADAAAAGGGDGVVDDNLLHVEVIQGPLDEAQSCDFVVRVKVPRASGSSGRPGADIVCAVDVSGSMQMAATYEDGDGNTQDDGLSMLDIVKHALRTIVATLTPNDRFSIVSFSSSARVVLPLTAMDDDGTSLAESKIQHLNASGQTNLWDGMFKSMNAFLDGAANGEDVHSGRTKAMLVLTDGQPNVVPPRGHLAAMDDFLDKHPELKFQVSACVALSAAGVRLDMLSVRATHPPLYLPLLSSLVQLNTFGFGYNLDSPLLLNLARRCNGTFSFIPDALIVGTAFVHSVANVLATYAQSSSVTLIPGKSAGTFAIADAEDGAFLADHAPDDIVGLTSGLATTTESYGRRIELGPLQYGQDRTFCVRMNDIPLEHSGGGHPAETVGAAPYLQAVVSCVPVVGDGEVERATSMDAAEAVQAAAIAAGTDPSEALSALVHPEFDDVCHLAVWRELVISAGLESLGKATKLDGGAAEAGMKEVGRQLDLAAISSGGTTTALGNLAYDASGRMCKALLGASRFQRWGRHYLRSIVRAHSLQLCTNAMDKGLQLYGGERFRLCRDAGDEAFLALPPPAALRPVSPRARSLPRQASAGRRPAARPASPPSPPSMANYNAGSGGGCFAGGSTVDVVVAEQHAAPGVTTKATRIDAVQSGDFVVCANGERLRVLCAVSIARTRPMIELSAAIGKSAQSLVVTGGHPIAVDGKWVAARNHVNARVVDPPHDRRVYTLLMENGANLVVNGYECVTWGHGAVDPSIAHSFYGSMNCIVQSLRRLPGWGEDGNPTSRVHVSGCTRDAQGGAVVGFV